MNWYVFSIFAFVLLVLERGLGALLHIGDITPSLILIVSIYIALSAPRMTALWAAVILGLLVDVNTSWKVSGQPEDFALIGPTSLGLVAGTLIALELRSLVFRDSPAAVAVMVFIVGIFVQLVIVALITLRTMPWLPADRIANWVVADQLVNRFFMLVYSAVLAVPISYLFIMLDPIWGFTQLHAGSSRTRRIG